jgi:uncharacterized protein (DUF1499 family)
VTLGKTLAVIALGAAGVAVLLIVAAGPGTRFGLWGFKVGLGLLAVGVLVLGVAAVAGLAGVAFSGGRGYAAMALLAALAVGAIPLTFIHRARSVPPIHDVTTDTDDPPFFSAVLARRGATDNPAVYAGAEIAAQQRRAYPDIQPLETSEPPARAYERALAAVRDLGWEIAAADPATGRIEATDTTFWFGFKDDVAVRIRGQGAGSRIDVRSASRVGRGDVGKNAERIRRLLSRLKA